MKRILSCVLVLALALSFTACSIETVEQYNSRMNAEMASYSESSKDESNSSNKSSSSDSLDSEDGDSYYENEQSSSSKTGTSASSSENQTGGSGNGSNSDSAQAATAPSTNGDSGNTSKAAASKGNSANSAASSQQETITVTISVVCTQIIGHEDFDSSTMPSNGVLLSTTSVKLEKGATVYDALKATCSGQIDYQAGYVKALFGIYEKMFGEYSGWKYKVNGVVPRSIGCNSYKLSDSDIIEWYYTTSVNG